MFLGTENGDVIALDAQTGDLIWHTEVGNEVMSDPAVGEGRVVVHTGGGKVISLDASTGEQQWEYEYQTPMLSVRGASAPAIISGGVIVGDSNGNGMVLISDSGQQAWTQTIGEASGGTELERLADVDAAPASQGTTLYMVAYNGELVALELMSGEVRWKRDYKSFENMLVTASRIFLTDVNSHVYALDQNGGIERWSNTRLFGRELSAPADIAVTYLSVTLKVICIGLTMTQAKLKDVIMLAATAFTLLPLLVTTLLTCKLVTATLSLLI